MPNEWETPPMWKKWVERQMYELNSITRGMVQTHSERIADLVEMIAAIQAELTAVHEKLDKVADYVRANVSKKSESKT